MTVKEIINGLKFTVDMFLFDASTGETFTEPRNDMDKTTIEACKGAIELLEQTKWIPVSERLPEEYESVMVTVIEEYRGVKHYGIYPEARYSKNFGWEWAYESGADYWEEINGVIAWMPLPEPYKAESEEQ